MDLFETDQTQRMTREQAATRLRELADSIARHNSIEVQKGGNRVTVSIPAEVDLKLEVEIGDENELEIEISW
jgi:amphi-Trp domain-containing protein